MATALFVCLYNAGRSQMSAALFERAAGGRHRALSAGSEANPAGHVHQQVVDVMRELGIDLSGHRPQRLSRELAEEADVVVTMGCGDACPHIPAGATSTGIWKIPRIGRSTTSVPPATRSPGGSATWSLNSTAARNAGPPRAGQPGRIPGRR